MRAFGKALSTASALALALTLSACGQGAEKAPPPNGELNIYTARHYDADLKIYDAFTKATGIKVNRLEMNPDQLIQRVKAEGEASPADVILMADAGALWRAEAAGLLQPVQSETLNAKVPAALRDDKNEWFGFSRRARVIAYDKAKVKPEEVATYEALAGPRFKGKVCVRSSDNVYNLSLMSALIERWGRDKALQWAKGVAANMARDPQGGDIDQIKAVAAGVCEVALTNSYYYLRLAGSADAGDKAITDKAALAFPSLDGHGTHTNISGGGMARNAPHRVAAVKFLEFLTTDEVQSIFAEANAEFPVVPTAKVPAVVQQHANFTADPMPVTVYGERQAEAQTVFDEAGWR